MEADASAVKREAEKLMVSYDKLIQKSRKLSREGRRGSQDVQGGFQGLQGTLGQVDAKLGGILNKMGSMGKLGIMGGVAAGVTSLYRGQDAFNQGAAQVGDSVAAAQAAAAKDLGIAAGDARLMGLAGARDLSVGVAQRFNLLETVAAQTGAQRTADEAIQFTEAVVRRGGPRVLGDMGSMTEMAQTGAAIMATAPGISPGEAANFTVGLEGVKGSVQLNDQYRRYIQAVMKDRGNLSEREALAMGTAQFLQVRQVGGEGTALLNMASGIMKGVTKTVDGRTIPINVPESASGLIGQVEYLLGDPDMMKHFVEKNDLITLSTVDRSKVQDIYGQLLPGFEGSARAGELNMQQQQVLAARRAAANVESAKYRASVEGSGREAYGRNVEAGLIDRGFGIVAGPVGALARAIGPGQGVALGGGGVTGLGLAEAARSFKQAVDINVTINDSEGNEYQAIASEEY